MLHRITNLEDGSKAHEYELSEEELSMLLKEHIELLKRKKITMLTWMFLGGRVTLRAIAPMQAGEK